MIQSVRSFLVQLLDGHSTEHKYKRLARIEPGVRCAECGSGSLGDCYVLSHRVNAEDWKRHATDLAAQLAAVDVAEVRRLRAENAELKRFREREPLVKQLLDYSNTEHYDDDCHECLALEDARAAVRDFKVTP